MSEVGFRSGLLGDFIKLKRGYDLPHRDRRPGDVPIMSSSGHTGDHNVAKVPGPGVITGRYGTLGEVFYVEQPYWPLNTALYVQEFKGNHPRFVSYFLKTLGLGKKNAAGAVPGVNRNVLHKMAVEFPDIGTQTCIADILSAYDDLIENNNRRMALLEEAIHLLYREWFVYLRYPGHERVEVVDGVPDGWRKVPLSEVCTVNRESLSKRSAPAQINYVDIASVTTGRINAIQPMEFDGAPSRARRIVRSGDIIWATVRPGNRAYAFVLDPLENLVASTGFAVLSPSSVPMSFLYCATTTDWFVAHMKAIAGGAAYPAVKPPDFEAYELVVPKPHLLSAFDDVALPLLRQMHLLEQQNQHLREARDLLLPRFMNGSIAV